MCGAGNVCRHYSLERLRAGRSSRRPRTCVGARRQAFPEVPACPVPRFDGRRRFGRTTHNRHRSPHEVCFWNRSFLTSPVQSICRRPAGAASTECAQQPNEPGVPRDSHGSPTVLDRRVVRTARIAVTRSVRVESSPSPLPQIVLQHPELRERSVHTVRRYLDDSIDVACGRLDFHSCENARTVCHRAAVLDSR